MHIDLIKKNKATDFEFSVGKSTGVSTAVRLSKVETLHLTEILGIQVIKDQAMKQLRNKFNSFNDEEKWKKLGK